MSSSIDRHDHHANSPPSVPAANHRFDKKGNDELEYVRRLLFVGDRTKERRFVSEVFDYFHPRDGPYQALYLRYAGNDLPLILSKRMLWQSTRHAFRAIRVHYPPLQGDENCWYTKKFIKKLQSENADFYLQNNPALSGGKLSCYYLYSTLSKFICLYVKYYQRLLNANRLSSQYDSLRRQNGCASALAWLNSPLFPFTADNGHGLDRNDQKNLLIQLLEAFPVDKFDGVEEMIRFIDPVYADFGENDENNDRPLDISLNPSMPAVVSNSPNNNNINVVPAAQGGSEESVSGGTGAASPYIDEGNAVVNYELPEVPSNNKRDVAETEAEPKSCDASITAAATGSGINIGSCKKVKISTDDKKPPTAADVVSPAVVGLPVAPLVVIAVVDAAVTSAEPVENGLVNPPPVIFDESGALALDSMRTASEEPGSASLSSNSVRHVIIRSNTALSSAAVREFTRPPSAVFVASPASSSNSNSNATSTSSSSAPSKMRRRRANRNSALDFLKQSALADDGLATRLYQPPPNINTPSPKLEARRLSSPTPVAGIIAQSPVAVFSMLQQQQKIDKSEATTSAAAAALLTAIGTEFHVPLVPEPIPLKRIVAPFVAAASPPRMMQIPPRRSTSVLYSNSISVSVKSEPQRPTVAVAAPLAPAVVLPVVAVAAQPAVADNTADDLPVVNPPNESNVENGDAAAAAVDAQQHSAPQQEQHQQQQQQQNFVVKNEPMQICAPPTNSNSRRLSNPTRSNRAPVNSSKETRTLLSAVNDGAAVVAAILDIAGAANGSPAAAGGEVSESCASSATRAGGSVDRRRRQAVDSAVTAAVPEDDNSSILQFDQRNAVDWSEHLNDKIFQFLILSIYRDLYSQAGQNLLPQRTMLFLKELDEIKLLFFDNFCANDTKGMEIVKWRAKIAAAVAAAAGTSATAVEAPESSANSRTSPRARRSSSPSTSSNSSVAVSASKMGLTQTKILDYAVKFLDWLRAKVRTVGDESDCEENSPRSSSSSPIPAKNEAENGVTGDDVDVGRISARKNAKNPYAADQYDAEALPNSSRILFEQKVLDLMLRVTLFRLKRSSRPMQFKFSGICCRWCDESNIVDANEHFSSCAGVKHRRELADGASDAPCKIAGALLMSDMLMKCPFCVDEDAASFRLSKIGEHFQTCHDVFELEMVHDAIEAQEAAKLKKKRRGQTVPSAISASAADDDVTDSPTMVLKYIKQTLPVAISCDECEEVFTQVSRYVQHILPTRQMLKKFQQPLPTPAATSDSYRDFVWRKFYTKLYTDEQLRREKNDCCWRRFNCTRRLALLAVPTGGKKAFAFPLADSFLLFKYVKGSGGGGKKSGAEMAGAGREQQQQPGNQSSMSLESAGSVPASPVLLQNSTGGQGFAGASSNVFTLSPNVAVVSTPRNRDDAVAAAVGPPQQKQQLSSGTNQQNNGGFSSDQYFGGGGGFQYGHSNMSTASGFGGGNLGFMQQQQQQPPPYLAMQAPAISLQQMPFTDANVPQQRAAMMQQQSINNWAYDTRSINGQVQMPHMYSGHATSSVINDLRSTLNGNSAGAGSHVGVQQIQQQAVAGRTPTLAGMLTSNSAAVPQQLQHSQQQHTRRQMEQDQMLQQQQQQWRQIRPPQQQPQMMRQNPLSCSPSRAAANSNQQAENEPLLQSNSSVFMQSAVSKDRSTSTTSSNGSSGQQPQAASSVHRSSAERNNIVYAQHYRAPSMQQQQQQPNQRRSSAISSVNPEFAAMYNHCTATHPQNSIINSTAGTAAAHAVATESEEVLASGVALVRQPQQQ